MLRTLSSAPLCLILASRVRFCFRSYLSPGGRKLLTQEVCGRGAGDRGRKLRGNKLVRAGDAA